MRTEPRQEITSNNPTDLLNIWKLYLNPMNNKVKMWEYNAIQENMDIKFTTSTEVANEIKTNLSIKKAPEFDLITGEILKKPIRKAIVKLFYKCCI